MSNLEIIACLISVIGVALTVFRSMWSWAINFVAYILYGYLFYCYQLYAEVVLQSVLSILGFYGFYHWLYSTKIEYNIVIENLALKKLILQLSMTSTLSALFGFLLQHFTHAVLPMADAQLAGLSLLATYWTAQKYVATWILWIVIDIAYVVMFSYKNLYLTAGLYAGFVLLAIYGLLKWSSIHKKQRNLKL